MKIRTDVILRLRDHLLDSARPAADHHLSAVELADAVLRRIEPFAEVMYLVISADTVIDPAERTALLGALDILCDGAVDTAALDALIRHFEQTAADVHPDPEQRVAAATARIGSSREDRETAFLLAAAVALADDDYELREQHVIGWARTYLGISERRVADLLSS